MHCAEARKRLSATHGAVTDNATDRELYRHLQHCPDCARFAQSERTLQNDLTAASADDIAGGETFSALRAKVESRAVHTGRMENIMRFIRNQYTERPRLLWGMGLALTLFLLITLVPLPYSTITGYSLTIPESASVDPAQTKLLVTLALAGYHDIEITTGENENDLVIVNIPTRADADNLAGALHEFTGANLETIITPIYHDISGTLYAQAMDKIKSENKKPERIRFSFDQQKAYLNDYELMTDFGSSTMTDREIKMALIDHLAKQNITEDDVEIDVSRTDDGKSRVIEITVKNSKTGEGIHELALDIKNDDMNTLIEGQIDLNEPGIVNVTNDGDYIIMDLKDKGLDVCTIKMIVPIE